MHVFLLLFQCDTFPKAVSVDSETEGVFLTHSSYPPQDPENLFQFFHITTAPDIAIVQVGQGYIVMLRCLRFVIILSHGAVNCT